MIIAVILIINKKMEDFIMKKNIKKSIIAGALALAMLGTAVPVTANAATTNGNYSSVSISRTASGSGTVTGYATATNNTGTSRYVVVYVRSGSAFSSSKINSYNKGTVAKNGKISTTGYSISNSYHCYGVCDIYNGSSAASTRLESIHATN